MVITKYLRERIPFKIQTYSVSEELNLFFGAPGTESRRTAEKQAWEENNGYLRISTKLAIFAFE